MKSSLKISLFGLCILWCLVLNEVAAESDGEGKVKVNSHKKERVIIEDTQINIF
jgi:hypothetical protein